MTTRCALTRSIQWRFWILAVRMSTRRWLSLRSSGVRRGQAFFSSGSRAAHWLSVRTFMGSDASG